VGAEHRGTLTKHCQLKQSPSTDLAQSVGTGLAHTRVAAVQQQASDKRVNDSFVLQDDKFVGVRYQARLELTSIRQHTTHRQHMMRVLLVKTIAESLHNVHRDGTIQNRKVVFLAEGAHQRY
jgi:hypothetical protein